MSGIVPGVNVNLRQIADVKPDWSEGMIVRRNGVRTISVFADTQRGLNLNKVTDKTLAQLSALHLPAGVTVKTGQPARKRQGVRSADIQRSGDIHHRDIRHPALSFQGHPHVAAHHVFAALLDAGRRYRRAAHARQEVGLTGTLGMISLMGIIVRNGIIMIDYAEELRKKHHLSAKHAALQAAQRRMRPIFLTSAAASMGASSRWSSKLPMWGRWAW